MDFVKVYVYTVWSFELTAKLVPTPARRQKLVERRETRILESRVHVNINKVRNVLRIVSVLQRFKTYHPPAYAVVKVELPKGHH